ncbi:uncharacterized protein EV422DRAFT_56823 [Fimicolochytrium jonesii]|uniref:uncharacterized protein n=1 Tax=Fimicolochytrium jonesii TaxID=1396493 RepID=UPI0022FDCA6D|nr:uncharacterized protein EV422DRAFT_56823 [Fimicolochytrium jonesii]KAI8821179.1 hypothetical protein EV422DRAFT_56823 [Fimicolochytrium jonesii]
MGSVGPIPEPLGPFRFCFLFFLFFTTLAGAGVQRGGGTGQQVEVLFEYGPNTSPNRSDRLHPFRFCESDVPTQRRYGVYGIHHAGRRKGYGGCPVSAHPHQRTPAKPARAKIPVANAMNKH